MKNKNITKKGIINKKKLLILLIISVLIVCSFILIINKNAKNSNNNENNSMNIDLVSIFNFNDINNSYDSIINVHGTGTDNYSASNKVSATVYNTKVMEFNCENIFYYNEDMKVEYIEYIINDNSIYEVMNKMKEILGNSYEYNDETEELSTEFKWKYENYLIILKYNMSNANIVIKSNI